MSDLRALSFLQPWLWAILEHYKGVTVDGAFYAIENRKWAPPRPRLGERIALHASAGWDREGAGFVLRQLGGKMADCYKPLIRGAILGTAVVAGAIEIDEKHLRYGCRLGGRVLLREPHLEAAQASVWAFGPWTWLLADVRKLPNPIPCKGALGLWRVPPEIAREVENHA